MMSNSINLLSQNADKELSKPIKKQKHVTFLEPEDKDIINDIIDPFEPDKDEGEKINFSFNEEDDTTILDKAMAICPRCGGFPFIELTMGPLPEIKIDCDCYEKQIYLLSEYVREMNHSNIIFKLMCYKHSKDFEFYCVTCQEHLCEQCL